MGPSGYGFLHPAAIQSDSPILTDFIANTVTAAEMLSMSAYVHWDIDSDGLNTQRYGSWLLIEFAPIYILI